MESYTVDANNLYFTVPQELRIYPQWVAWRWGKMRKNGKQEKIPIAPRSGSKARTNDPNTWSTFEEACAYARKHSMNGIGFVFSEGDPFCGVDLDDCIDPETGQVYPGVAQVLSSLNTYSEISPSGKGIKVICRANKPGKRSGASRTRWGGGLEIYDRDRFFTVTGDIYHAAEVRDSQEALNDLYWRFFPEDEQKTRAVAKTSKAALSHEEIEVRIEKARNHPKTGALLRKLFDYGDPSGYRSRSEADLALCGMLAYWFGSDAEQVKELFRQSALAQGKYREKGRYAEAYLDDTVEKAITSCTATYDPAYGERLQARVREIVSGHRVALSESTLRKNKRAVMVYALKIAMRGRLRDGEVEFNLNQEETGEEVGISQRAVSNILRGLMEEGWLLRVSKGKKGTNSVYRLPAIGSITYADREIGSTTYEHMGSSNPTPVGLRSRTFQVSPDLDESPEVATEPREENQPPHPATEPVQSELDDASDAPGVLVPFEDFAGEIYTPAVECVAQQRKMIKDLPPLGEDGIYHHGPECQCGYFCDEDAPEYIPTDESEVADVA